jgi:hypothetical protein
LSFPLLKLLLIFKFLFLFILMLQGFWALRMFPLLIKLQQIELAHIMYMFLIESMFVLLINSQLGLIMGILSLLLIVTTTWDRHGHLVSVADQNASSSFHCNSLVAGFGVVYVFVLQWAEFFTELRLKSPTSYLQIPSEICYIYAIHIS